LYNYLVDFGGCEQSLRPLSEVCAILVNVTNQEPIDYPGALVDLCEAVFNVLFVGLNVVRRHLLHIMVCHKQVAGPIKLHQRVTLTRLGVLVLPDVKRVVR
jgi:sorbitol-specific phosphotransferase system component IIA